ncbi:MAG: CDC27 family protein [Verrucomicrobiota bacterium]
MSHSLLAQGDSSYSEAFGLYKSGDYDKAWTIVSKKIATEDKNAQLLELAGRILTAQKKYDEAETKLLEAISLEAKRYSANFYLGENAFQQDRWDEAASYYAVHIRHHEDAANSILKSVYAYIAMGNLPKASMLALKLDINDPLHPGYYFAKAALASVKDMSVQREKLLRQARTIYGQTLFSQYQFEFLKLEKLLRSAQTEMQ